jgi:hypothetical protein
MESAEACKISHSELRTHFAPAVADVAEIEKRKYTKAVSGILTSNHKQRESVRAQVKKAMKKSKYSKAGLLARRDTR